VGDYPRYVREFSNFSCVIYLIECLFTLFVNWTTLPEFQIISVVSNYEKCVAPSDRYLIWVILGICPEHEKKLFEPWICNMKECYLLNCDVRLITVRNILILSTKYLVNTGHLPAVTEKEHENSCLNPRSVT
jgi:hypothetical protein